MIDISDKNIVKRRARASGIITLQPETIARIKNNEVKKGDVLTIARIAGINAVKKVPDLIPLCHPIPIHNVEMEFNFESTTKIKVICEVFSQAKTGVEMEALTGASVALLNIWDVAKMYEKDENGQYPTAAISEIIVEKKIKEE